MKKDANNCLGVDPMLELLNPAPSSANAASAGETSPSIREMTDILAQRHGSVRRQMEIEKELWRRAEAACAAAADYHGQAKAREELRSWAGEVLTRLIRYAAEHPDRAFHAAFLNEVARNVVGDSKRRALRRPAIRLDDLLAYEGSTGCEALPDRSASIEQVVHSRLLRERILSILSAHLRPDARETLLLSMEGFSCAEIAVQASLPPETVKKRLTRARAVLRPLLKDLL